MAIVLSRKQEIRHVAEKMFRERGYSATSMRELARAVGMEAPSLYNHFSSKEALLHEICFGMADAFFKAFESAIASETEPISQLKAAMLAHIGVIAGHLESADVFFKEWNSLSEPDRTRFKELRNRYQNGFRNLISQGIADGSIVPVHEKLAVFTLLSAMNAVGDLWRSRPGIGAQELSEQMCRLLIQGIQNKP